MPEPADRWTETNRYVEATFGAQDEHLAGLMERAVAAGLPDIAVSPATGRTLLMLASLAGPAPDGARLALELGTLGGYSAIWIARGLAPAGRLLTLEPDDDHADFAQAELERAGVADRVEIVRAAAPEALDDLRARIADGTLDFAFLDAIKRDYSVYLDRIEPMLAPGAIVTAHNALGGDSWWITDPPGSTEQRDAIDAFNRRLAADPNYEATVQPVDQGLLIARRASRPA